MTPLLQRAGELLQRLKSLSDSTAVTSDNRETARAWIELIEHARQTLERHDYSLVFVGKVGVGKSSLVSISAGLFIGNAPHDKATLQEAAVLPLAAGRTTAFEIRLRGSDEEPPRIGLELEPMTKDDFLRELRLFADGEWRRRRDSPARRTVDDGGATAIETDRILRGMIGYAEEYVVDPATKRRRLVRPLDSVVTSFATLGEFTDHVLARANLDARTQTSWTCTSTGELKGLVARIHHGEEPFAALPERVTLIVPQLLRELEGPRLSVVDTRGLDGSFESRADLLQLLRDPGSIPLLCSSFADAPDENTRAVLRAAQADPSLAESLARALLILLDRDDASQVDGANGDRHAGQDLKVDECNTTLHNARLASISRDQIVAFDLFQDDRQRIIQAIQERLTELRRAANSKLEQHLDDAQYFLETDPNGPLPQLRKQVDQSLSVAGAAKRLRGAPLSNPIQGALDAIRGTRYGSVVYASCRRNGAYHRLNVYAAIDAAASRAATGWLDPLRDALTSELAELKKNPAFGLVEAHIRLREQQFAVAHADAIRSYASSVSTATKRLLEKDPVWATCSAEWGEGDGFKDRVLTHLDAWSRRQNSTVHEQTDFIDKIPFAEVDRPPDVPRFTLRVRNLRALVDVQWTPEPVSLLIGANGVGKTTLLEVLRFLHRAYDAGLARAVTDVFRGSNNLRSWNAGENETIEIGLTLGDYAWTIALVPRNGTVEEITHERLTDGDREVFLRDSLGSFVYHGEHLEPTGQLGLRVLAEERRVPDPAVRAVATLLGRIHVYRDLDLWLLRDNGSKASDNLELFMRGNNALAVLRRWANDRTQQHRYDFVLGGLRQAFPGVVEAIDFVEAGNTVTARLYRPGSESPRPHADEANGVLLMLILLCCIASAEEGSLLAIDEPENGLHPYAVREFLRRASRWSRQHRVTILLATHSLVLLDAFNGQPDQVYVLRGNSWDGPRLMSLAEQPGPDRLEGFELGDLYEQGELGSNEDDV